MTGRTTRRILRMFFFYAVLSAVRPGTASAQQIISEVRIGALAHDVPVFGSKKEPGIDINGELLFTSPVPQSFVSDASPGVQWLLTPRPNIGISANTGGATSQVYFGLVWTATLATALANPDDALFLSIGFGPAFNNGYISTDAPDRKSLGSHVLFHPSLEVGYRFDPRYSMSLYFEHSSNGGFAERNDGLNNLGIRLGAAF